MKNFKIIHPINKNEYMSIIKKNWFLPLIMLAITIYFGPVKTIPAGYNPKMFYNPIIDFIEVSGFMIALGTIYVVKSFLKSTEEATDVTIGKTSFVTHVAACFMLLVMPAVISYTIVLFSNTMMFGLGSVPGALSRLLVVSVVLYSVVLITNWVVVNTGSALEAVFYTLLILIAPFLIYDAISLLFLAMVPGFSIFRQSEVLGLISPIAAGAYVNEAGVHRYGVEFFVSYWFIINILFTNYLGKKFEKRTTFYERNKYTNNRFKQVVSISITAMVLVYLTMFKMGVQEQFQNFLDWKVLLLPLLIGLVLYFILFMIQNRKIGKFQDFFVTYTVISVITLVVCSLVFFTKGMGFSDDLPKTSNVSHVSIVAAPGQEFDPFTVFEIYPYIRVTNPQTIDEIIKFHRDVIQDIEINGQNDNLKSGIMLDITYYMKEGEKVNRNYFLPENVYTKLRFILGDLDVAMQSQPIFLNDMVSIFAYNDVFTESQDLMNYKDQLIEAYRKDLTEMTPQDRYDNGTQIKYNIIYTMDFVRYIDEYGNYQVNKLEHPTPQQIVIDDRYVNTVKLINSLNLDTVKTEPEYILIDKNIEENSRLKDGRVKLVHTLNLRNELLMNGNYSFGEIELYSGHLKNTTYDNSEYSKLVIRLKNQGTTIRTVLPIID